MRKAALIMVLGLLSVSVLCMFAPAASAGTVSVTPQMGLLPDVYKVDNVTFDGYSVYVDQKYPESYNFGSLKDYRYYATTTEEDDFHNALVDGDVSLIPPNSSVAPGTPVTVFVFIYDDPSKFTVRSGAASKSLPSTPYMESDAKFYLYSGQSIKLTMTSSSSIRFGMDYYSNYYNISTGNNTFSIMSEGEYRLFDYYSSPMPLFASFTIEYDEPPASVAGYGAVMLILGSVCIGVMLFLGRGQKIKD